jgi:hypothetical protein
VEASEQIASWGSNIFAKPLSRIGQTVLIAGHIAKQLQVDALPSLHVFSWSYSGILGDLIPLIYRETCITISRIRGADSESLHHFPQVILLESHMVIRFYPTHDFSGR